MTHPSTQNLNPEELNSRGMQEGREYGGHKCDDLKKPKIDLNKQSDSNIRMQD